MGINTMTSENRDDQVNRIIAAFLEDVDAGNAPNRFEIIANNSEFAVELAEFFFDRDRFEKMSRSFQDVAGLTKNDEGRNSSLQSSDAGHVAVSQSTGNEPHASFGDYELLEEIARGGMGVVYKARQISLNRVVALKMILAGNLASNDDLRRFHAEAEAAAGLNHPGIVPIYEVGAHDGQCYFSMAYVDGPSLADTVRYDKWRPYDAANLIKQICEAVQFAHDHDIIHRDLKPANILLQRKPPTPMPVADERTDKKLQPKELSTLEPRVTDFGLAKRTNIDSRLTGTGQILGTPSFMAPEQAGRQQTIDARSDVYSLGAILYQMLTGRPPFQEENPLDTLTLLINSDPLPPRILNRGLPGDLEAICMKCLNKEPSRRYQSARQLGNDLKRFLNDEAIQASSVNLLDCMTRLLRQNRNEGYFRGWGLGLIAFGLTILASHVGIYFLENTQISPWFDYLLPRSCMFAGLLFILWQFRPHSILPTNSAERLVWIVWSAYLIGLGATNAIQTVFEHDQRESYAIFAILAGFGFLVMGVHVWGGGYIVGLVFMIAAPILAIYSEFAPLLFGSLWAIGLFSFGVHYWRRGQV